MKSISKGGLIVFCPKCGEIIPEQALFCPACGTNVVDEKGVKTSPVGTDRQGKGTKGKGFHCPNCGSVYLNMVISAGKHIWVCNQCGEKFQDLDQFKKNIELQEKLIKIYIILGIIGAAAGMLMYKAGKEVGFEEFKMMGSVLAIFILIAFGGLAGRIYNNLPKMKQEYDELERRVKDK